MQKEELNRLIEGLQPEKLRTLRAIINGKLSRRTLTTVQQEDLIQSRRKVVRISPPWIKNADPNTIQQNWQIIKGTKGFRLMLISRGVFGFGGSSCPLSDEAARGILSASSDAEFEKLCSNYFMHPNLKMFNIPCEREKSLMRQLQEERENEETY